MRIVIFGASGMVGRAALIAALAAPDVTEVIIVVRHALGLSDPKLTEIVAPNLADLSDHADKLAGLKGCLFCLGISSSGISEANYTAVTYDLTLSVAKALLPRNPDMCFQYVSGEGTDSSETGSIMWARVKGRTENELLGLGFASAYMLRPGAIIPLDGIRSRTPLYQLSYTLLGGIIGLLKPLMPGMITDTRRFGATMLELIRTGYRTPIVTTRDINLIGKPLVG
ncbi:MAG: epimerase [Alphaproteobacteria bacterium]|nr:epimerase [Alphaproteobacteria bacterium]